MFLDLEMYSKGVFPRSERDPIIGSGYSFSTLKNHVFTDSEEIIHLAHPREEFLILNETIKDIQKERPQIIVTFYGNKFDLP